MYYYHEYKSDLIKVIALAKKYKWFRLMWNETAKVRDKYSDSYSHSKGEDCGKVKNACGMLEYDKETKLYSCKIHQRIGFDAKPRVCTQHSCERVRKAEESCMGCKFYKEKIQGCDEISAGESKTLKHLIPPNHVCNRWRRKG